MDFIPGTFRQNVTLEEGKFSNKIALLVLPIWSTSNTLSFEATLLSSGLGTSRTLDSGWPPHP